MLAEAGHLCRAWGREKQERLQQKRSFLALSFGSLSPNSGSLVVGETGDEREGDLEALDENTSPLHSKESRKRLRRRGEVAPLILLLEGGGEVAPLILLRGMREEVGSVSPDPR
jgi:hypothetical protein